MKKINNVTLFIFTCLTLSNIATNCFYYGDDPAAGAFGGAATGALVGGVAGGGRGAAIGAGVGAGLGLMSSAAARDRGDRYYRDRDYYDDGYNRRSSRRSYRQRQRDLETENAELQQRLQQYEPQQ